MHIRRAKTLLFVLFLTSVFLFTQKVFSANTDIVINEIGAYEKSGLEWIEIFNKGVEVVDIEGWKFWEAGVNHGLKVISGDFIVEPGEYVVITQKDTDFIAKYPSVSTTIIDSSWGSLKEAGEEIGLKDSEGNFIEQFTYIEAKDFSLQRKDPFLTDYTSSNWEEHSDSNTVGSENVFIETVTSTEPGLSEEVATSTETVTSTEEVVEEGIESLPNQGGGSVELPTGYSPSDIVINELVSDPADGLVEFVELFNNFSDPVDLSGWTIEEGSESVTKLEGLVQSFGYFVIEKPKGNLNNSGDSVTLYDPTGREIDGVVYGKWDDGNLNDNAAVAKDPKSIARRIDGGDTDNDSRDFVVTEQITKGSENIILISDQKPVSNEQSDSVQQVVQVDSNIIITELYPNPPGSDQEGEFIEIENSGNKREELSDWKIGDGSRKRFTISDLSLVPGERAVFFREQTGLALNNSKEESVTIYHSSGTEVDSVTYTGPVPEGFSYSLVSSTWDWSSEVTPGDKNTIVLLNREPEVIIQAPSEVFVGETVTLDASDTVDPEGDELTFFWQSGKSISSTRDVFDYVFERAGNRVINLTVDDGNGNVVKEKVRVAVLRDGVPVLEDTSAEEDRSDRLSGAKSVEISDQPLDIRLSDLSYIGKGSKIRLNGVVAVQPGILGSQFFYLVDDGGIQVYMHSKDFPDLEVGDRVEIVGELSEAYGEKRLKIKNKKDITALEHFGNPIPSEVQIASIGEDLEGSLVSVSGEITESKSSYVYVDDGTEEVKVYMKKGTGIERKGYRVGDEIKITGLVSERSGEYQLLPRSKDDIEKHSSAEEVQVNQPIIINEEEDTAEKYLTATAGGLTSILIGLFAKARGSALVGVLKRAGLIALSVVRRKS